jgi:hypothetical protein
MTKGQILPQYEFGLWIDRIITDYSPKNIVEIGTWKGLGSTKCIIDSIIKNNLQTNFMSFECNKEFYLESVKNLENYKDYVNLIYGRLVEFDEVIRFCKQRKSQVNLNWLIEDLYNMSENSSRINLIPKTIDFLLLDGGEYSTYIEWQKLKDRTKIVALDDTKETKTKEINNSLSLDPNYKCLINSNERNGFAFYLNTEK